MLFVFSLIEIVRILTIDFISSNLLKFQKVYNSKQHFNDKQKKMIVINHFSIWTEITKHIFT